jgi:5-methylcytosine-specific restriction endonuclease McrBC GTP-binding regulatory subunit McrB
LEVELKIDRNLRNNPLKYKDIELLPVLNEFSRLVKDGGDQHGELPIEENLFKEVEAAIHERTKGESREGEPMGEGKTESPFDDRSKYPSKNIILYGPPGTGKTFGLNPYMKDFGGTDAKGKEKRWAFITFHQSYSYEDFIEGIKPDIKSEDEPGKNGDGQLAYKVRDGIFKKLAKRAEDDDSHNYALFIDEINRGNVASIFGELITLIEEDKRLGEENAITVKLPYSHNENEQFGVPKNLYVIGTMNTADRSVEALDAALRRRFSFIEMPPKYDLKELQDASVKSGIDLKNLLQTINGRIEQLLDRDHCIGHSYFLDVKDLEGLRCAFANRIIPLLKEYFYGSPEKVGMVLGEAFVRQKEDKQEEKKTHFAKGKWGDDEPDEKKVYEFTEASTWQETHFKAIYL